MRETASAQCDTHAVSYAYTNCNHNTKDHANTHDYCNADAYPDGDGNALTKAYALTKVPSDSAPSPDSTMI
jgi:hypothetical protein